MYPAVRTGLSLTKILGGISKTLNVANQIIPLYLQAKPVLQNARGAFKIAKGLLSPEPKKEVKKKSEKKEKVIETNQPVFFL